MDLDDGCPKWSGHKNVSKLMPHDPGQPGRLGLQGKKKRKVERGEDLSEGEAECTENQKKGNGKQEK